MHTLYDKQEWELKIHYPNSGPASHGHPGAVVHSGQLQRVEIQRVRIDSESLRPGQDGILSRFLRVHSKFTVFGHSTDYSLGSACRFQMYHDYAVEMGRR